MVALSDNYRGNALRIAVGIMMLIMVALVGPASADTFTVGKGRTYATIQSAIDAANTGDVILVDEGNYYENLVVKKNGISIMGKNKEKTVIDGKKTGSVVRIEGNNVIINEFTVQNSGGSGKDDAGISFYSANNNMVANMLIVNNIVGISIYSGSNNNLVSGNEIKSNSLNGILIFSSSDNKIYNNNIQDNKIGIYADSARTNRIYSNNFIDNNDQAYDNSGKNSWDDGRSGNYWSSFRGSGAYDIAGGAKDNYPLSSAVTIKYEPVPTPAEQKTTTETGKSSPAFAGIIALISVFTMGILKRL